MRKIVIAFIVGCSSYSAASADDIMYRYRGLNMPTGQFSPIAEFQRGLADKLKNCPGSPAPGAADGTFGRSTSNSIIALVNCNNLTPPLPADSPARRGAITSLLWTAVTDGKPLPSAEQRANDLTLVFEATDYTALEFNYCQSKNPSTGKTWAAGDSNCFSNDPCSYATWGPRGATAGHGHEIQTILWELNEANSPAVKDAFGTEYEALERLLGADDKSAEIILCSAFAKADRRSAWKQAFSTLGIREDTQSLYKRIYNSRSADGAKMQNFYRLYERIRPMTGRDPTEVDFAWFLDRSTHGGSAKSGDIDRLVENVAKFIKSKRKAPSAAEIRWELVKLLPVGNQQQDRLGRDVVYVYDAMGERVGSDAITAWQNRGPFRASDFGLSDDRFIPTFAPEPASRYADVRKSNTATAEDIQNCPAVVLKPVHPRTGKPKICNP